MAADPHAQDRVESWFEARVAARLRAAGVATLADLVKRINGLGQRWWSGIKGIGAHGGARILRFVQENEDAIGMRLGPQPTTRRRALDTKGIMARLPRVTAVVPLERFAVPAELSGANERFRAPPELCMVQASNDYEAIVAWLASKSSRHTARA